MMFGSMNVFENEEYDVLYFSVETGNNLLGKANELLRTLPHESMYKDYIPHATIAYLKKGMGKKYVDQFSSIYGGSMPDALVFSKSTGEQQVLKNYRI